MKKLLVTAFLFAAVTAFSQKQPVDVANKYAQNITTARSSRKTIGNCGCRNGRQGNCYPGPKESCSLYRKPFPKVGFVTRYHRGYQMQYPVYQDTLLEASLQVNGKMHKLDNTFSLDIASAANGTYGINEIIFASYGIVDSSTTIIKVLI
jgi:hypothetical protein